jgi:hypothetical protein
VFTNLLRLRPEFTRSATLLFSALVMLTPTVLLVHGYHPLADDGAIYVAGVKKLANPSLYPSDSVFALAPTRLSMFAHVLAPLLRCGSLPVLLLLFHLASIFLYLAGAWRMAACMFSSRAAAWGALLLAACAFTLPVAGTSLSIMDPYVTARSFSTPLMLFALSEVLAERWSLAVAWLALAALLHPLMAAYTAIAMLTLFLSRQKMWRTLAVVCALGWLVAALIFVITRHVDANTAYSRAALSRSYFFLSSWQWYEYLGLVFPLLLLGLAGARNREKWSARAVAIAATITGGCALLVSLCFVHRSGSLWMARLQPLRAFQFVYLAGVLLAGGRLGKHKRVLALVCLILLGSLFTAQRFTYPESSHVEWPNAPPRNRWQEAFLWIRAHTPNDAIFGLDNDYIEGSGEDAQGFRATAERSAVADWYKDGGIAANFPQAATLWWQGAQATAELNRANDDQRLARLRPLGVSWIVLPASTATRFRCPYVNFEVRVCKLE